MGDKCGIWFRRSVKSVARVSFLLLEHGNSGVNHRHAHLLPKCPHCWQMTQSRTCWGLRFSMWSSDRFRGKSSDAQLGIRRRRNRLSSAFTTFYHGTKQRNIIPSWNSVSVSQFLFSFSQKSLFFVFFERISSCYSFALFTGEYWAEKCNAF